MKMTRLFFIIKRNELKNAYKLRNSIFEDIKFTNEKESDNRLAFLGILITRTNSGKLKYAENQRIQIKYSTLIATTQQHTKLVVQKHLSKEQKQIVVHQLCG
ncbi:unnamed protein product [Heterobilharzia americana]|nr:unnamed protein product [Heterobilharzia americana]CAH8666015.1 unnamed protein product [Heterobilharzia americana]